MCRKKQNENMLARLLKGLTIFFFCGRSLNYRPYIYYVLFLSTQLSLTKNLTIEQA